MADFNCVYDALDVPALYARVAALDLVWVRGDYYEKPVHSVITAKELLAPGEFPRVAHGYFEPDMRHVTLQKIVSKRQPGRVFYTVNDLASPEHLNLSAFLHEGEAHAGFFGASYHSKYLSDQGVSFASAKLKATYAKLRRSIQEVAAKVRAGQQDYLVLRSAAAQLVEGRIRTTFSEAFDAEIVRALQKK